MSDIPELIQTLRNGSILERVAANVIEKQARRIAELDKAAKDTIKEVSYWSAEAGKRDARIAELEAENGTLRDALTGEK